MRQHGEAWNHPFCVVVEPSAGENAGLIASVTERHVRDAVELTVLYRAANRRDVVTVFADGNVNVAAYNGKELVDRYRGASPRHRAVKLSHPFADAKTNPR